MSPTGRNSNEVSPEEFEKIYEKSGKDHASLKWRLQMESRNRVKT